MKSYIILVFIVFLTSACGGGYNPNTSPQKADDKKTEKPKTYSKLGTYLVETLDENESFVFSNNTVQGSGLLKFIDYFKQPNMGLNFYIDFTLHPGSEVKLITFADKKLNNGLELSFVGINNKLSVTFKSNESIEELDAFMFNLIDSQEPIISIDIHNDHGNSPHILIWDMNTSKLIFNSSLTGKGFGTHWGLLVSKAQIHDVKRSPPKDTH